MLSGLTIYNEDVDATSILADTHGGSQAREEVNTNVDRGDKVVKTRKSSDLLSRRRGKLSLSMKMPCVEKQACPLMLLSDRYKVFEKLGSGCAGMVHRAVSLESGCEVALKIPRNKDPAKTAAAEQEYELLKRLAPHPNIIKVFDFHNLQGEATLVLELFDGGSLQATVQEKVIPERTARSLCIALFNAVDHVHQANIIHRDIKPQNILVSRCLHDLRLIDFNVATCLDKGVPLTPTGTELYKAPELLLGETPCERSDVWASGLCTFFMLSGSLPHGRDSGHCKEDDDRPDLFDGAGWQHVSGECKDMLQRCLDSNREERPMMPDLLDDAWLVDPLMRIASLSMLCLVVPGAAPYLSVFSSYLSDALNTQSS